MLLGDIYLSYARVDDQTVSGALNTKGFVSSLHNRLLADWRESGKPQPSIFRDTALVSAADQFEPRLGQALTTAKFLVVVLSRDWLECHWCRRELEFFLARWRQRGETEQRIKERIFVVLRHGVAPADRPASLQGHNSYPLMYVDPESQKEFEYFDVILGRPRDERWFTCIRGLAKDLRSRLYGLAQVSAPVAVSDSSSSGEDRTKVCTVYVARPAVNMAQSYAGLVEELRRRTYRVVPDPEVPLPEQHDAAVRVIDAALDESLLSIHLLSDEFGSAGQDVEPNVRLQLERAAQKVLLGSGRQCGPKRSSRFHRLIWAPSVVSRLPEGVHERDPWLLLKEHTRSVSEEATDDEALLVGDKFSTEAPTKFLQFFLQHVGEVVDTSGPHGGIAAGAQVYVQHDERDAAVAEAVAQGLKILGIVPVLPFQGRDTDERKRAHNDALQTADAVLLCWATATSVWVRAAAAELRRWQDLGRHKAFVTRALFIFPPRSGEKERLSSCSDLDEIIDALTVPAIRPNEIEPFLRRMGGGVQ